jgi:hypothetical protein
MRPLLAEELLSVWERGMGQSPARRALLLLGAACPDSPIDLLASLSIGQRDALLLTLREWTFGSDLLCRAQCLHCGEQLELNLSSTELRVPSDANADGNLLLNFHGYEIAFRTPNSHDLNLLASCRDVPSGRQLLLQRCLHSIKENGETRTIEQLPTELLDTMVEQMEQRDPQANIELMLSCPVCKQDWRKLFDIESFFWKEIGAWVGRILNEIHTLASNYGWSELDLLRMTTWRRQAYLNLVNQ